MSGTTVILKNCKDLFALMSRQYSRENMLYVKQEILEAIVAMGGAWCRAYAIGFLRDSVDSLSTLALESSHPASGEHPLSPVGAA